MNFAKKDDREQSRKDSQSELDAINDGIWPRDTNDMMRWRSSDPQFVKRCLEQHIEWLAKIGTGQTSMSNVELD